MINMVKVKNITTNKNENMTDLKEDASYLYMRFDA